MAEVKTVGDLMREMATKTIPKISNVLKERCIGRRHIDDDSNKYAYCPYCYPKHRKVFKKTKDSEGGEDWKDSMSTLWLEEWKYLVKVDPTTAKIGFEQRYKCDECKRYITPDDYLNVYGMPPTQTKATVDLTKIDLNDPNALAWF